MTIHKEGFTIIFISLLIFAGINYGITYTNIHPYISLGIFAITLILLLLIINFFRSPIRVCTPNEKAVIAPADGKIVVIEEVDEPEFLKTKCKQVSIFMSPMNVHINWYPIAGNVKYVKHHNGRFMGAYLPKSSTENERSTVVVERKDGVKVLFRQVAGAMARRIVTYSKENTQAKQGGQMGFIKFGSRIDLYLPLDADIKVNIGDKVKGTDTIIAEI